MIPKDGRSFYFEEPREIWSEARRGEGCEGRLCGGEADRRSWSVPIPLELTKIYQGIRMH